jgi:hypothetical protein
MGSQSEGQIGGLTGSQTCVQSRSDRQKFRLKFIKGPESTDVEFLDVIGTKVRMSERRQESRSERSAL